MTRRRCTAGSAMPQRRPRQILTRLPAQVLGRVAFRSAGRPGRPGQPRSARGFEERHTAWFGVWQPWTVGVIGPTGTAESQLARRRAAQRQGEPVETRERRHGGCIAAWTSGRRSCPSASAVASASSLSVLDVTDASCGAPAGRGDARGGRSGSSAGRGGRHVNPARRLSFSTDPSSTRENEAASGRVRVIGCTPG